jgi:hypothetical protein
MGKLEILRVHWTDVAQMVGKGSPFAELCMEGVA